VSDNYSVPPHPEEARSAVSKDENACFETPAFGGVLSIRVESTVRLTRDVSLSLIC